MTNEEKAARLPAGWGWPGASRKAHYFAEGASTSLCHGWAFTGSRFDEHDAHSDNCKDCARRVLRLRPNGEPSP